MDFFRQVLGCSESYEKYVVKLLKYKKRKILIPSPFVT